jgi:TATA-box binding protein (TBP) (component of TFIID and TFIIIB)
MTNQLTSIHQPKINNVKARFTVHQSEISLLLKSLLAFGASSIEPIRKREKGERKRKVKQLFKQYHNFIVIRLQHTFIIFPKSGTVNVTGVRCLCLLSKAVEDFCVKFGVNSNLITIPIVDNITASGKFDRSIDLLKLKKIVNNPNNTSSIISVTSNPSYFPSAFCRTIGSTTCSVFPKGSYNIIGAKCQKDIQEIMKHMTVLIQKL